MLLELAVNHFALIDRLHLQFGKGLNILSGETGAGKSIIIDAVNLAIGERADREFIRTGSDKALIQAVFSVEDKPGVEPVLLDNGIELEEDRTLVITRELYANGRSLCRVNGTIVTQTVLKSITRKLIDIHGQHQHQSLLDAQAHIHLLDAFGGPALTELLRTLAGQYREWSALQEQLKSLYSDDLERERRMDLLRYQIQELEAAALTEGEEEALMKQKIRLNNGERIFKMVGAAYELLHGDQKEAPALDQLAAASGQLNQVAHFDEQLTFFHETMEAIQYQLEDLTREIRDYRDSLEFEPEELETIEQRLDLINQLKRKYGKSIGEILQYLEQITQELERIENSQQEVERLNGLLKQQRRTMETTCQALSQLRQETARVLEKALTEILKTLNMGKVNFQVQIQPQLDHQNQYRLSAKGYDQVEFLLSANLGEPLKPLSKIASGGEMSRIMLALKRILAEVDHVPTLIFDEIDTGISGKTAQVVGQTLYDIARNHQVLCITHLPQIAALADVHYLIEKKETEQTTLTQVKTLSQEERIQEVGRLLGGTLTEITLQHAKELIGQGHLLKEDG